MERKLTGELVKEYKQAFDLFDRDGDGHITASELGNVLRALGQRPTASELKFILQEIDANGNGMIEFNEFSKLMHKRIDRTDSENEIRDSFKVFDLNGDGFISADELRHVMRNLGQKLSNMQCEQMIQEVDVNGDGLIDYEEYVHMITK